MDYIQQDLDLIRTAGSPDEEMKKHPAKKKAVKTPEMTSNSEKEGTKKIEARRAKTASPIVVKTEVNSSVKREKRGRKSVGSAALGKIKLPFFKKQKQRGSNTSSTPNNDRKATPFTKSRKTAETQSSKQKESNSSTPSSSKSKQGIDPQAIPIEAIRFVEGAKIEAIDSGKWYKAKIIKVDEEEMDILVHFDGWGARFDTWFPMTSALIRGRTQLDEKPEIVKFEEGEDVLGRWSDGSFYPATVLKVAKSGSYNIMFFDGLKKSLRPSHLKKMTEKEKEEAMQAAQKLLLLSPELVLQDSSESTGSRSSDGRRYRTSANDRDRRLSARTHEHAPGAAQGVKRKAVAMKTPGVSNSSTGAARVSDEDTMVAKKARLDKITTNLINRASPTAEIEQKNEVKASDNKGGNALNANKTNFESTVVKEENVALQNAEATKQPKGVTTTAKKVPGRRGRPPKRKMQNVELSESTKTPEHQDIGRGRKDKKDICEVSLEKVKIRSTSATTPSEKGVTIQAEEDDTEGSPSKISSFEVSDIAYDESSKVLRSYKPGDIVLAKWADCRSYLAYIVNKESEDSYKIRYYDGHIKVVKAPFIHPWIGPLPDSLKIFKPKPPQTKLQRRKSLEMKRSKGRPILKTTGIGRGLSISAQHRRRTIATISEARHNSPVVSRRRRTLRNDSESGNKYRPNEKVIAKWTDLRWYPATIVKKIDNKYYQVMYADNMTKTVLDTWLSPWTPPTADADSTKQAVASTEGFVDNNANDTQVSPKNGESHIQDETGKVSVKFLPGRTVLARYTDGCSYPATVKSKLDGDKYLVEFDNGLTQKVTFSAMKPWSKTALPPLKKKVLRRLYQSKATELLQKPQIAELLKQEKSEQAKTALPKQAARGQDMRHSKLPIQEELAPDHYKFKCKVPGCNKSYRKEETLKAHHKHYHQQRYKLRDQENQSASMKKKAPKDEGSKQRVPANYEVDPKIITDEDMMKFPKSRGAKPPMEIYEKHRVRPSRSPTTDNNGSVDEINTNDAPSQTKTNKAQAQTVVTLTQDDSMKHKARSPETRDSEPKENTAEDKQGNLPENNTDDDEEVRSDPVNEDVIRCSCEFEEEDGFMIQCETCLTWQHAACVGVKQPESKHEKARDEKTGKFKIVEQKNKSKKRTAKLQATSDGYICWVCKNPRLVRRSRKYHYNNEFLSKGKLPSLLNVNPTQADEPMNPQIRVVTSMMEEIVTMQERIVGIKNMIKVLSAPDHPLLKTWKDPAASKKKELEGNGNSGAIMQTAANYKDKSSGSEPTKIKAAGKGTSLSDSKIDILKQKENLLDHVTEIQSELDSRITRLIDYIAKLNDHLDVNANDNTAGSLQEDLTVVQRLLSKR